MLRRFFRGDGGSEGEGGSPPPPSRMLTGDPHKDFENSPLSKEGAFKMLRTFVLADFITFLNACCGTACIFLCINSLVNPDRANLYICMALILPYASLFFDVMDGEVARWRQTQSILGKDLDSLSDIVSFAVAPSVIGYTLGMRGLADALSMLFFVACAIARLARYNATAPVLAKQDGKVPYYEGFPVPTSLSLVLGLGVCWWMGAIEDHLPLGKYLTPGGWTWHPLSLVYFLWGVLMTTSRLRIPKPDIGKRI
uniref:CDP-diacylglycerol--serine O-phosphatidyltransferase n=1 Tax=Chromera velia CCMP2878 TaxID=1169474 RepID=A0A0G4HMS5_9ALVE|mmetsp:Transcript_20920/g.41727  ORF Transcript_20920/g.41727 Transcript_20920/m.41727 type:complete len:254 (-) Transcript_20920:433-1194(-)|eukprot:Cvel_7540.t1-p1 / transcript=Cvel_7540.t1 / gene=Cvel_7540 / organism=Chromera_velia_CCMP2878 / gene_product=CDP-diacylglycerol--serine, putative / transcript_product=CDP-diacylglycerol--serine, putative / location=Cvel_scaffold396:65880-66638(+) / protein_length=253 / sequence_SO=supercontig / SO=protein_coding / is_pseudo=false